MTLKEYKEKTAEIAQSMEKFNGTQEEIEKFIENVSKKYPELNEFNNEAIYCDNIESFNNMAKSYGMEFSSEEECKELFDIIQFSKNLLNEKNKIQQLSKNEQSEVNGGSLTLAFAALAFLGGSTAMYKLQPYINKFTGNSEEELKSRLTLALAENNTLSTQLNTVEKEIEIGKKAISKLTNLKSELSKLMRGMQMGKIDTSPLQELIDKN